MIYFFSSVQVGAARVQINSHSTAHNQTCYRSPSQIHRRCSGLQVENISISPSTKCYVSPTSDTERHDKIIRQPVLCLHRISQEIPVVLQIIVIFRTYWFLENISEMFEINITRKKKSREETNPPATFIPKLEANSSR